MRHLASPKFWEAYKGLPEKVRSLAEKNFALLKQDPRHPSLHFKRAGPYWSVRVGLHYGRSRSKQTKACSGLDRLAADNDATIG